MDPYESKSITDVIEPGQHINGYERFAIYQVKDEVVGGGLSEEHGQLLSCLHPKVQMQALEGLRSLDETPSPGQLRGMIEKLAVVLDTQGFDKSDCSSCRFNSSNHLPENIQQASLVFQASVLIDGSWFPKRPHHWISLY